MMMRIEVALVLLAIVISVQSKLYGRRRTRMKLKRDRECTSTRCRFDVSELKGDLTYLDDIELELTEGVTRTFKTLRSDSRRDAFHGEDGLAAMDLVIRELETEGPGANATLVFGSMSDEERVYQIAPDEFGDIQVTVKFWKDFGDEIDPMEPPVETETENRRLANASVDVTRKLSPLVKSRPRFDVDANGRRRKLYDDKGGNIDVMVVWTRDAECDRVGKPANCKVTSTTRAGMIGLIELAIEETNVAYTESGVNTQLRLVHAYRHGSYVEVNVKGRQTTTALADITYDDDGKMDDVHRKRDQYGADMVAIMVAGRLDGGICGTAWSSTNDEFAFSSTKYSCATGYFSFGHEIGHNMGCYHDRGRSNSCDTKLDEYRFGWRDPNANFRTILGYSCQSGQCDNNIGGGCPRIQRFSSSTKRFNYKGNKWAPLGDQQSDCARRINDVRAKIASFRKVVECEDNSDCSDNDLCTRDTCSQGECVHTDTCSTNAPTPGSIEPPPPSNHDTLFSTDAGGNGQAGNYFDIDVSRDVEIVGFDIHTRLKSNTEVEIWTRPGKYTLGNSDGRWKLVDKVMITGKGEGTLTELPPLSAPIKVRKGERRAFYITLPTKTAELRYTDGDGNEGDLYVSDGVVSLYQGRGVVYPFKDSFAPRIFNGNIKYRTVSGPEPTASTSEKPTASPTKLTMPPSNEPTAAPKTNPPTGGPAKVSTQSPTRNSGPLTPTAFTDSLFTTDIADNGQGGNYFDIDVTEDVEITSFSIHTRLTTAVDVEIWTRRGPYQLNNNDGLWSLVEKVTVVGNGEGNLTALPALSEPIKVWKDARQAFYITLPVRTAEMRYTDADEGTEGQLFVSDGVINVYRGRGVVYPFKRSFAPRIWNGIINYNRLSVPITPIPKAAPCQDDPDWIFINMKGLEKRCKWIAKATRRCNRIGVDGRIAGKACLKACNLC